MVESGRPDRAATSRRGFLAAVGGAATAGFGGCLGAGGAGSDSLVVFHAGSLAAPFERVEATFEDDEGVRVDREAQGSVFSTQKITEQGRRADVLAVSDYRLLRERLLPEHGSWYAIFQTNAMTVHYTDDSPGAGEIERGNWWEVLSREGVRIGHSDPAVDPSGYRAVMTQQLGRVPFEGEALYDGATYEALRANSEVSTGTEVNLVGQLASGKLDYAFNYRSVGASADVNVVSLQPQVDLSRATERHATHYANASVETESGTFRGAPIAYGVAVPDVARAPDLGARWVASLLGEDGERTARETGFEPVRPAVVPADATERVPERVMDRATGRRRLGPLEL